MTTRGALYVTLSNGTKLQIRAKSPNMARSINWEEFSSMVVPYPITFECESSNWLNWAFAPVTSAANYGSATVVSRKYWPAITRRGPYYREPSVVPNPGSPPPKLSIISANSSRKIREFSLGKSGTSCWVMEFATSTMSLPFPPSRGFCATKLAL